MEIPGIRIPLVTVGKATKAALRLADEKGFSVIAFPGMGTGVGGVKKEVAANAMIETIADFNAQNLKKIILSDIDKELVEEWKKVMANRK